MEDERYRKGKFTISRELLRESDFNIVKLVMQDIVVFHTIARFDEDEITYYAYHPSFDKIAPYMKAPEYTVTIETPKNATPVVTWKRK